MNVFLMSVFTQSISHTSQSTAISKSHTCIYIHQRAHNRYNNKSDTALMRGVGMKVGCKAACRCIATLGWIKELTLY